MANQDRCHPSRGVPEHRVEPLPRGAGRVRSVPPFGRREFPGGGVPRDGGRHFGFAGGGFAGRSPTRGRYEVRRNDRSFESQRNYGPRFPLRGARTPPMRHDRVPMMGYNRSEVRHGTFLRERCFGVNFANPSFEQMARHWFDSFGQPSGGSFAFTHGHF